MDIFRKVAVARTLSAAKKRKNGRREGDAFRRKSSKTFWCILCLFAAKPQPQKKRKKCLRKAESICLLQSV